MVFYTGQILITAANYVPEGWYACDGSLYPSIYTETLYTGQEVLTTDPLLAVIYNSFGGDVGTTFAVPDLMDQVPTSMVPIICSDDSTLGSTIYYPGYIPPMFDISSDTPFVALVDTYSTDYAPTGWADCNGAAVPMNQYISLYTLIGNEFGQSTKNQTFNLPDLSSLVTFRLAGDVNSATVESIPFSGSGGVAIATAGLIPIRS